MSITELVGVFNARGSVLGEIAYVWGKVRGTGHCELCDITHSGVRRKKEWDAMVAQLPVPFRLVHLDELDADVDRAVTASGAPVVLARDADGLRVLLDAHELGTAQGSVSALHALLRDRLGRAG